MMDIVKIKYEAGSCLVEFSGFPSSYYSEAIYIENEYNERVNSFLSKHFNRLQKKIFNTYEGGFTDLVYVPHIVKKLTQKKQLFYWAPFLNNSQINQISSVDTTTLLQYLDDPDDACFMKPGFMFFKDMKPNGVSVYEYYPLFHVDKKNPLLEDQIKKILLTHSKKIEKYRHEGEFLHGGNRFNHGGLFCTVEEANENTADEGFHKFDRRIADMINRLEKDVRELMQHGVSVSLLEKIIHQQDQLSRMVINKEYRIFLPEYNQMEITMEPLVKAVYFLFLKHPEGIVIKHLPDYREELTEIYKQLRPLGMSQRAKQSIEDVTNPLKNSINEKCARIRSAFEQKFDEHLAKNYFITGERGMAKGIALPRNLVTWE